MELNDWIEETKVVEVSLEELDVDKTLYLVISYCKRHNFSRSHLVQLKNNNFTKSIELMERQVNLGVAFMEKVLSKTLKEIFLQKEKKGESLTKENFAVIFNWTTNLLASSLLSLLSSPPSDKNWLQIELLLSSLCNLTTKLISLLSERLKTLCESGGEKDEEKEEREEREVYLVELSVERGGEGFLVELSVNVFPLLLILLERNFENFSKKIRREIFGCLHSFSQHLLLPHLLLFKQKQVPFLHFLHDNLSSLSLHLSSFSPPFIHKALQKFGENVESVENFLKSISFKMKSNTNTNTPLTPFPNFKETISNTPSQLLQTENTKEETLKKLYDKLRNKKNKESGLSGLSGLSELSELSELSGEFFLLSSFLFSFLLKLNSPPFLIMEEGKEWMEFLLCEYYRTQGGASEGKSLEDLRKKSFLLHSIFLLSSSLPFSSLFSPSCPPSSSSPLSSSSSSSFSHPSSSTSSSSSTNSSSSTFSIDAAISNMFTYVVNESVQVGMPLNDLVEIINLDEQFDRMKTRLKVTYI